MNRSTVVLILLVTVTAAIWFLMKQSPEPILWYPRYEYQNGKMPYDVDVLVDLLKEDVGEENVIKLKQPFHLEKNVKDSGLYLSVEDGFYPDSFSAAAILHYVEEGNTAFIAAEDFDQEFMDKLFGSAQDQNCNDLGNVNTDNMIISDSTEIFLRSSATPVKLKIPRVTLNWRPFRTFDYDCLPKNATILGKAENNGVNLLEVTYGKGSVFLHSMPVVFTNFILKDSVAFGYLNNVFNPIEYSYVYFDEMIFERRISDSENPETGEQPEELAESAFKHLFENRSLRFAFTLLILGIFLFVVAASRRKQPIVAVVQPVVNSSISFSKTIARMYWLNPNHKKMAEKRMQYFLSEIRNRYHIETNQLDETFIQTLTHKTGVEKRHIAKLFERYQITLKQQKTHADQLTQISDAISFIRKNWK